MKCLPFFILTLLLIPVSARAEIRTQVLAYEAGGVPLTGYLAYDDSLQGKRPGILVVHEWWGQNEYARRRARMLAGLGYTALAVDMYGNGKVADHPDEAGRFAQQARAHREISRARFEAALKLLKEQPTVDADRIAAIGYCFGGGVVLEMAREGVDLAGVVSFHGSLSTDHPAEPGKVKARVLVLNGSDDAFTTPEQIEAFIQEMEAAGVDYEFLSFQGAKHSFTNPDADRIAEEFGLPIGYDEQADRDSWAEMKTFLNQIFGQDTAAEKRTGKES